MNYNDSASTSQVHKRPAIAILGGTFDPIHNAHIALAEAVLDQTSCETVFFVPCKSPTHKHPAIATPAQRAEMVKLAIDAYPQFQFCDYELTSNQPSYMLHTLQYFNQSYPNHSIYLILGQDAFAKLNTWHQWEKVLERCHLLVAKRPGCSPELPPPLSALWQQRQICGENLLHNTTKGCIMSLNINLMTISATDIRLKRKKGENIKQLLPKDVYDFINRQQLYTG